MYLSLIVEGWKEFGTDLDIAVGMDYYSTTDGNEFCTPNSIVHGKNHRTVLVRPILSPTVMLAVKYACILFLGR